MTGYLNAGGIRIFDYPEFAKRLALASEAFLQGLGGALRLGRRRNYGSSATGILDPGSATI